MSLRNRLVHLGDKLPTSVTRYFSGTSPLAKALRPLANRMLPHEPRFVSVLNGPGKGNKLFIHPQVEKYYWTGLHEPHVQKAIAETLEKGHVFWDVGAHIGMMSLIAARKVGVDGRVHAFEPVAANRERLTKSIAANKLENVQVYALAVGKSSGKAEMHVHESSLMWSLGDDASDGPTEMVQSITLDDLWERVGDPTLIKVDAEGYEVEVLEGGLHMVSQCSPTFIVEFTDMQRLARAQHLLPDYTFTEMGQNHWFMQKNT